MTGRPPLSTGGLLALLLAVAVSFWLAPAPQGLPDVEYWGEYVRVAPGLGFVLNHDSQGYLAVAEHPGQLLQPHEVRQSRPLYALLAAAVGYPLTAGLQAAGRLGLAPGWPAAQASFYGFYSAYVLLNALALLGSLLLLRWLAGQLAPGPVPGWLLLALAWILAATPITKAFFWTAHQQLLAFLVPLGCLALTLTLARRPLPGWGATAGLALGLGLLPLVYGSLVLVWPALAGGLLLAARRPAAGPARRWPALAGRLLLSAGSFAVPTLAWIALLRLRGTPYYNHEAEQYHQLVWLLEARHLPAAEYLSLVAGKLAAYGRSLGLVRWWLLGALLLLAAAWLRRPPGGLLPRPAAWALAGTFGCFAGFFALLGYYPERLAYTLLPLVLCLLAGLLPQWPARYARPLALALAAGWHLYVLLSYGPFS